MPYSKTFSAFIAIALAIVIVGCSNKSNNPVTPVDNQAFKAPSVVNLNVPHQRLGMSGEPHAVMTAGYIAIVKDLASAFAIPDSARRTGENTDSMTFTWSGVSQTFKIYFWRNASQNFWSVVQTGVWAGVYYDNWESIRASEMRDLSSGSMQIYVPNTSEVLAAATWTRNASSMVTLNLDGTEDSTAYRQIVVANADNTGYSEHYVEGVLKWKITWTATSNSINGWWYEYVNGVLRASGTFGASW